MKNVVWPINVLINYLKDHGIKVVHCSYESITVIEVYSLDGKAHEQEVTIKADWRSVRNWLGY
jgi:exonuclease III